MISVAYVVRPSWRAFLLYYPEEDRWYLTGQGDSNTEFAAQGDPDGFGMIACSKPHARRLLYFDGRYDLIEEYREALDPRRGDHRRR